MGKQQANDAADCCVSVEPSDFVTFQWHAQMTTKGSDDRGPETFVTIRNGSADKTVTFKVLTTSPIRYLVRPNHGILPPNETVRVVLALHPKFWQDMKRTSAELRHPRDKFLVLSTLLEQPPAKNQPQQQQPEFTLKEMVALWGAIDKTKCWSIKLRCHFLEELDPEPEEPEGAREEEDEEEKPYAGSPPRLSHDHGLRLSEVPMSVTLLQERFVRLQKRYDHLVASTLAITAERDALKTELAMTRQELMQKNSSISSGVISTSKMRRSHTMDDKLFRKLIEAEAHAHTNGYKTRSKSATNGVCKKWASSIWCKMTCKRQQQQLQDHHDKTA